MNENRFRELLKKYCKKGAMVKKEMKQKQTQTADIDVKALYEEFGEYLEYCDIVYIPKGTQNNECDYYELYNDVGTFVCINREICEVTHVGLFSSERTLRSNEPNYPSFDLTKKEFECATRGSLKKLTEIEEEDARNLFFSAI